MSEPKKALGQHWLHDTAMLGAIVEAADLKPGDFVLEIGPGTGTLTDEIVKAGVEVLALEFDHSLIPQLNMKFANSEQVKIVQGDIRTFDFGSLPKNYKVVANIPYYLTSHLIRSISETSNPPSLAVLLIQKEVAQRLCAKPGQMSILSLTAQFYYDCKLGLEIPAKFFTPPPKVDSQVVQLFRRQLEKLDSFDEKAFFKLVKAGFSEKRKTLRNSLSGGLGIEKLEAEDLLTKAGLSAESRAQELSLKQWHELYLVYGA